MTVLGARPCRPEWRRVLQEFLWAFFSYVLSPILFVLILLTVVHVIMGWLIAMGTVRPYGPNARMVLQLTSAVVEPMLKPIRRILPRTPGIDFSSLLLLLLLGFAREYLIPRLITLIPF
jgi:YggT family protein